MHNVPPLLSHRSLYAVSFDGYVITSGCILRTINLAMGATGIGLSASKLAHYSKTEREVPIYYGTEQEVMDAAVSGYWNVR